MPKTNATKKLETFNRAHNRERDRRVAALMRRMQRWAASLERRLLGVLAANRGGSEGVRGSTDVILLGALEDAASILQDGLRGTAEWAWESATRRFVRAVPMPVWLRRNIPAHSLYATEGELLEYAPNLDIDDAIRRILSGALTIEETRQLVRELEFGTPSAEELDAVMLDTAWPDGLDAMARIRTVPFEDIATLRDRIGQYLTVAGDNESAWGTLTGEIQHLVGNVRYKAVRIARTEATRVAEDMLRKSWDEAGDLIDGIRTFTADDANVRDTHRKWHNKLYRKTSEGTYIAGDDEYLPRFPAGPNCRCWSTPQLRADLTAGLPDEDLGPEYRAALDRFKGETQTA